MKSSSLQRFVLALFAIGTVWYSFFLIQPPEPKSKTAAPDTFSAERAFEHVRQIATTPHPLGSAPNDSVRKYLVEELQQLRLDPEIQDGLAVRGRSAGYTNNIIAKIPGRDPQNTIMLMAHYDSVPNAPGAADDASGIAAILETIRAIQSQETPPKNNILILFTDGEERGLLGARLFVDNFADLDKIDLVLNFEARGTSGSSMMFETSSPNNELIPHFAQATTYPVANSLMYTVYQMMPNDTDLSITKEAGLPGLNFAFTKEYLNYHTMQDSPENLSLSSLQHHGTNMLDNSLYFGNKELDLSNTSEFVYFNNASGGLSYYPASWSLPIALITALLFLGYLFYLFRTDRLSIGKYLGSLLLFLGVTIIGAVVTYFGWQGIKVLHPEYEWLIQGETYNHRWYFWGFTLLTLAFFSGIYSWMQHKLSTQQLLTGSYTLWILLSLGTAWYLPTASYILSWPALIALIGWISLGDKITEYRWKSTIILGISLTAVLFMIPPYIHQVQIMLTTELLAVSMIQLLLLLGLAWPLAWQIIRNKALAWNTGFALAAVFCFIAASTSADFDPDHKKQNNINYVQNHDTGQAYWFSQDDTVDSWTRQFLGGDYQKGSVTDISILENADLIYRSANMSDIPKPQFDITADSSSDSLRFASIQLETAEEGIAMIIDWGSESPVTQICMYKETLFDVQKNSQQSSVLLFQNLSDGVKLDLAYDQSEPPPTFTFTFIKQGLPTELISNYQERAPDMMPSPSFRFLSDATAWQSTLHFDKAEPQ